VSDHLAPGVAEPASRRFEVRIKEARIKIDSKQVGHQVATASIRFGLRRSANQAFPQ
jgi:hypothetical protein